MGIFSLFGKKDRQQTTSSAKRNSARKKSDKSDSTVARPVDGSKRAGNVKRDAQAARATAMKIDAIESEMSSEFVKPVNSRPGPTPVPQPKPRQTALKSAAVPVLEATASTQPAIGPTTRMLLEGSTTNIKTIPAPSSAAVIEEAAIMFANNQAELVKQMLRSAITEDLLGDSTLDAWGMLFDLYQIMGKQEEFDDLSIEYANKFETSPPAWITLSQPDAVPASSSTMPMVPFSSKLDGNCVKQIERAQKLAENHQALRLEFIRVTGVDAEGCTLLLGLLKKLQKSGRDLVLVGAPELIDKIKAIIEVGRRDDTENPWLLLLELLGLLNREAEFEETSIDYCVTFEVSPPAFNPPKNKITTAFAGQMQDNAADTFTMPAVIEGSVDQLILGIASYSDEHDPAIIDCSRLTRVDFHAAGRLLTGLAPFCGNGKVMEFRNVNYLVAALFSVMGLKDIVRVLPRK